MSERTIDANRRHFSHTLPFGAQLIGRNRARFRLWAPSCDAIGLEIDGAAPLAMQSAGEGWFEIEADCGPGARYQYRINDSLSVPDPASRFQPDDVHGPSQIICPSDYVWQHPEWLGRPWEETVLYELHVGACGGYAGVAARLPELKALGVTAIELMPLNDFPGARNWGYDGVLPFAPDASYGTPDELKALIDAAHGQGLMVFLDVVYNHFGPDGNYLHAYAESFFKAGTHTPWGPAINFDAPEVRDFFFENALYWLMEYRFDGLRLDAVHAIDNDGWLRELSERVHAAAEVGRQVHLVLENERNTAGLLVHHFEAQWSDDAHNTLHVLLTGETESYYEAFAERPLDKLARLLGEGFVYQGEPSPIHDGAPRGECSTSLPPSAFVFFLQNHDQVGNRAFGERLRSLTDDDSLRAATALMLLCPQIPMLFMGEENGSRQPFFFFTGYTGDLADAVREGRRKEFAKFAAFNDEARRAQIPDPNHPDTFARSSLPAADATDAADAADAADANAPRGATLNSSSGGDDRDVDDAAAWRAFYQDALAVRHAHVTPGLHGAKALGARVIGAQDRPQAQHASDQTSGGVPPTGAVVARWQLNDGQILNIVVNLGATEIAAVDATLPSSAQVIYTLPHGAADDLACGRIVPHSCIVTLDAPDHEKTNAVEIV